MKVQHKKSCDTPITADTLTQSEKLSAICWAANEVGMSYGKFLSFVTDIEKEKIHRRYAERLERQHMQEKERSKNIGKGRER